MNDIQNATLAGGVGIGSSAALLITPGYAYLSPMLIKYGITDTRGVLNLHFLPGVIGALTNVVSIAIAFDTSGFVYGQRLLTLFPSGADAAGYHMLALVVTIAVAGIPAFLLGLFMSFFSSPTKRLFTDESSWWTPSDFDISVAEIVEEEEETKA